MKIGILNSGGDVQGINAVIASAVEYGAKKDIEVFGFIKGFEGLLDLDFTKLGRREVRGISNLGGTILYSVNKGRFAGKKGEGESSQIDNEIITKAIENFHKLELEGLIVIGGDGTLSAALQLQQQGVPIVGIPKTIDNDLELTDESFGFSTAVNIIVESLDRIHTTAYSHNRVLLVETMGRHAGWLALYSGVAGGADAILIPEIDFEYSKLVEFLRNRKQNGKPSSIIVISEGANAINENISADVIEGQPEVKLSGISEKVMNKLEQLAPGEFDMRNTVLGHVQRGGTPNAQDRVLAKTFGVKAIDAILEGQFGKIVTVKNGSFSLSPLEQAVSSLKLVTEETTIMQTARKLGIFFGD